MLLLVLSLPACSWLDGDVKGKDGKGRVALRDWAVPASAPGGEVFQDDLHRGLKEALSFREAGYKPRTEHLNSDGSPIYTNRQVIPKQGGDKSWYHGSENRARTETTHLLGMRSAITGTTS